MIRDGGAGLWWHLLDLEAAWTLAVEPEVTGLDGSEPVLQQRTASATLCVRMTRLAVALHHRVR
jgi:hypothetical protein